MSDEKKKDVGRVRRTRRNMIRIGTSGFSYDHWFLRFYPKGLPKRKTLEYYQSKFDTVELNVSFYRLVPEKTYQSWHKQANPKFLFAVKGSRYITHIKRLKDFQQPLERFLETTKNLENNLGPILFQLPSNYKKDTAILEIFLEALPSNFRYAIEFRHKSWFDEEVFSILKDNNIALVFSHSSYFPYKEEITAGFIYLRLHGPGALYAGNYEDAELIRWAEKIINWEVSGRDVFVYFNNDAQAFAPKNALKLKELVYEKI
jgi:uncharacterized protein YecE (DUF72 family)